MIRYLLDELYSYETDYGDLLCPISRKADESHAGEAALVRPLCSDEARRMFDMHATTTGQAVQEATLSALSFIMQKSANTAGASVSSNSVPQTYSNTPPPQLEPNVISLPHFGPLSSQSMPISESLSVSEPIQLAKNRRGILMPITGFGREADNHLSVTHTNPRNAPDPSRIIPKVDEGAAGWRMVVRDWENADPRRSLIVSD